MNFKKTFYFMFFGLMFLLMNLNAWDLQKRTGHLIHYDYSTLKACTADIDGDGLIDILIGDYPEEGVNNHQRIARWEQDSLHAVTFHKVTDFFCGIRAWSCPAPIITNLDDDGLLDLIIGEGGYGQVVYYEQDAPNSEHFTLVDTLFELYTGGQDIVPTVLDIDGNNRLDLLLGRCDGTIDRYQQAHVHSTEFNYLSSNFNNIDVGKHAKPYLCDYNQDGVLDLFVGAEGYDEGEINGIYHYVQDGENSLDFNYVTNRFVNQNEYMGQLASFVDIDGDHYPDALIVCRTDIQRWEVRPVISIKDITNIRPTHATSGITLENNNSLRFSDKGICWSTSPNPTTDDPHISKGGGSGDKTIVYNGLDPTTHYYTRCYEIDQFSTSYSEQKEFTTIAFPSVSTTVPYNITKNSATSGGYDLDGGGGHIYNGGLCWSTHHNPTIDDDHDYSQGTDTDDYTSTIEHLSHSTTYYVRAWVDNQGDTAYGDEQEFRTDTYPTISTNEITNISYYSATGGGNVTDDGGDDITERGICWSTSHNPTVSDSHTSDGTGDGEFSSSMTGLTDETTYYVRAYAKNSVGRSYGNEVSFTTKAKTSPTVSTNNISNIRYNSATSGGNITDDGGLEISSKGVCWSISHNPKITDSHTSDGSGNDEFTSSITGLTRGTIYYVRAYATNSEGTSYGNEVSFTTNDVPTEQVNSIFINNTTSATITSEVTNNNGENVTERGVCCSEHHNPTLDDFASQNGTGEGTYDCELTGLQPDTKYYVKAYAKNAAGTSYSETEKSFSTLSHLQNMLCFNGSDSYLSANVPISDMGTVEAWVKLNSVSGSYSIFDASNSSSSWRLNYTSYDGYYLEIGGSSVAYIPYTQINTWHHIAMTWHKSFNGTSFVVDFILYLNGNPAIPVSGNSWEAPNPTIYIGKTYNNYQYLDGKLDEYRIWNVERTASQIQDNMNKTVDPESDGLLCYFNFDQSHGNTAFDRTSNAYNATLFNMMNSSWRKSSAPIGDDGKTIRTKNSTPVGNEGKKMTATIVSEPDQDNYLGIYSSGNGNGCVDAEDFPEGITQRADILWGVEEFGSVTANLVFDYSNLSISDQADLHLLKRHNSDSDWIDFTGYAVQDLNAHTFTLNNQSTFSQFSVADGGENSLPVELSSFTVSQTSEKFAELDWTSQSETDLLGYNIYRDTTDCISNRIKINPIIIAAENSSTEQKYSFTDENIRMQNSYYYWLESVELDGSSRFFGPVTLSFDADNPQTPDAPEIPIIPGIQKIYPNPFNPQTTISYYLDKDADVNIEIYNLKGQKVIEFSRGFEKGKKFYSLVWNGKNSESKYVASGIYFFKLNAGKFHQIKKAILLK